MKLLIKILHAPKSVGKVQTWKSKAKLLKFYQKSLGNQLMVNGVSRNIFWKLTPAILKDLFYGLGDKIGEFNLQQGENVEVSVDLESRNIMGVGTLMLKRGRFPKTVWVVQVEMKMETKTAMK